MHTSKKLMICDVILISVCLYLALLLRFDFNIQKEYILFFKLSIIPVIVLSLIFNKLFNLYNSIWKYASIDEVLSIIYSITLTNIIFIIYSYVINYRLLNHQYFRFPVTVHIIFWLLSIVTLGGTRFIKRVMANDSYNNISESRAIRLLIVGGGDAGALLIKEIKKHKELNYDIIGVIDDDITKKKKLINGISILGNRHDIIRICNNKKINEIIISIPSADYNEQKEILNICKQTKCKLKTLPGIYEIIDNKVNVRKLRDVNIEDLLGREPVNLDNNNIEKYIKGKTVMVTGGGGSIGSELCRQLAKFKPDKLLVLDIYENNTYYLQRELMQQYPDLDLRVVIASVRDREKLDYVFNKYNPDVVFHAAAHKHVPLMEDNPSEAIKNNVLGTYNVVDFSNMYNVKKFVLISTDKAVNPTNIMGATKRFCEMIIQAFDKVSNTEYVAVRFGNVLGSNGSVIPIFKQQIEKGGPVTVTHPEINRYFMTIPEAAQLVIQAGGIANGGEIFVLDMGEPVKIADLAKDLITLSGLRPDEDIKIVYTGLRPGEKLYEELLMDKKALNSTKFKKIFIEKPSNFDIENIKAKIEEFKGVINQSDEEIFELMQKIVPTYNHKKIK